MDHTIKPITSLTREERRALAQAAADRGERLHEACPFHVGTHEHLQFQDDYFHRRRTLLTPCE